MGREGAVSLHRFVNKGQHLMIHRNTRQFAMLDKDDIVIPPADFKRPPRQIREIDESKKLTMDYEIKQFSEEQIKKEAERCLKCGRSVVDTNKCIGCGMCTVQCKFDAIHLFRLPDGDKYSNMIPAEQKFLGMGKHIPSRVAGIIKKKVAGK
jgi:ferredoxin